VRAVARQGLEDDQVEALGKLQAQIDAAADKPNKAKSLWRSGRAELKPVRDMLDDMSLGRSRCMYCEDNEGIDIEHFWPKSRFPERTFVWENHLLACPQCNSNYKRTRFPRHVDTGEPLLLDPSVDNPAEHLVLTLTDGRFVANTAKGTFSGHVFRLNRETLKSGRRDAWTKLRELLPVYSALRRRDEDARADLVEQAIKNESFSAVRQAVVRIAASPAADVLLPQDVRDALEDQPEIALWP
jgi:uncharacterized protein (TIGR02646 family)